MMAAPFSSSVTLRNYEFFNQQAPISRWIRERTGSTRLAVTIQLASGLKSRKVEDIVIRENFHRFACFTYSGPVEYVSEPPARSLES